MFRNRISARQKNIFLIGALSAPLSTLAGMDGWLQTLLATLIVGVLAFFACRFQEKLENPGKDRRRCSRPERRRRKGRKETAD